MTAPHEPSDERRNMVEVLVVAGVDQKSISQILGITEPTLRKYYKPQLDQGLARAVGNVANTLLQKALNGDTTSIIFFLKTRGRDFGWRERDVAEQAPGKKAEAQAKAKQVARGRFAPASPPRLVVNHSE